MLLAEVTGSTDVVTVGSVISGVIVVVLVNLLKGKDLSKEAKVGLMLVVSAIVTYVARWLNSEALVSQDIPVDWSGTVISSAVIYGAIFKQLGLDNFLRNKGISGTPSDDSQPESSADTVYELATNAEAPPLDKSVSTEDFGYDDVR